MGPDHTPAAPRRALPARGLLLLSLALGACTMPPVRPQPQAATATATATAKAPAPASAPAYIAPTSGPTARLVMRATVQPGEAYGVYQFADAEQCRQPSTVGLGDVNRTPTSTTLVAGQLTTLQFTVRLSERAACWMRWSFVPGAGRQYLVMGNSLPNSCTAQVLNATNGDDIKPERTAVRRDSKQNDCIPMTQALAAGIAAAEAAAGSGGGNNPPGDAVLKPNASDEDLRGLIGP